jgi:hypothetical protein
VDRWAGREERRRRVGAAGESVSEGGWAGGWEERQGGAYQPRWRVGEGEAERAPQVELEEHFESGLAWADGGEAPGGNLDGQLLTPREVRRRFRVGRE